MAGGLLAGLLGVGAATQWADGLPYRLRQLPHQFRRTPLAAAKEQALAAVPRTASVVATFDLLARSAQRADCRPLSMVVAGRKVLSAAAIGDLPTADYVLVDFAEPLTFGGLYHAGADLPDESRLPPSEQLLRRWFAAADWECVRWVNSFAVFRRGAGGTPGAAPGGTAAAVWVPAGRASRSSGWVLEVARGYAPVGALALRFDWHRGGPAAAGANCWVRLDLRGPGPLRPVVGSIRRGPLGLWGATVETWDVVLPDLPAADYTGELVVYDRQAYAQARATGDPAAVEQFAPLAVIPVGVIAVPGATVRCEPSVAVR
jgi:hypothetical protein